VERKRLELNQLPRHALATEIACSLNLNQCYDGWPLLSDPYQIGWYMVKKILPDIQILAYPVRSFYPIMT